MKWKKLGLIFCANKESEKMFAEGRTPVPLMLENDIMKIFFASCDKDKRGSIFSLQIDINDPTKILDLETTPVVNNGFHGFYDDNGIITSSILRVDNKIYLYTIGFSVKNRILFDAAPGLAISSDNGENFIKYDGPILEKTIYDPCFSTSPYVLIDNGIYKMWYVSGIKWEKDKNENYKHYYNIRYKESIDGIHWGVKSKIAIDFKNKYEYALSRPTIMKDGNNDYKMWYSYRGQENNDSNRIGYAESKDGINWIRKDDEAGIDVSESGWDSEMICYPYVFDHKGKRYMFYNGNGYGRTGFGLAVLEED